ncbi:MAG: hypothetical protein GXP19_08645 [Gammaproteobacteria bacterium]|nr:hypothetical protein [Gammaproteobacteria bacterium]
MSNKLNVFVVTYLLFLAIASCAFTDVSKAAISEDSISIHILGSAEHPDPVLEKVRELEKKGILQNVIVRESFPVQIEVTGPRSVIKELQAIPKKESPSFQ